MSSFVDDVKNLIDKQQSDVKKAFLCLHSPYKVCPEYMEHVKSQSNVCDANPGRRAFAEKVLVDPDRYKEVYQFHHAPPQPAALEEPGNLELDMDHLPEDQVASSGGLGGIAWSKTCRAELRKKF